MTYIKDYLNNTSDYIVDYTYQREPDTWSLEDQQCLIDTILRQEPMPLFFFNYKSDEKKYYIVDGQQRLNAITKFYKNDIKLNKKFSGEENHNKTFNDKNPISKGEREKFLNYQFRIHILENYSDEEVRRIFSKLQRGSPLRLGERLNAKPGKIVVRMREIATSFFLKNSVGLQKKRYGTYPDAARFMYYEKYRVKDAGTNSLRAFFEEHPNIDENDKDFKKSKKVLNFLEKCFPPDPGNYQYLSKHAWVYATYTMASEMLQTYSLRAQYKNLKEFIEDFHGKVYDLSWRRSKFVYQKFFDNIRGGWSESIIKTRRDILIKEFLDIYNPPELDEQRQINEEDKIKCFHNAKKKCEDCGYNFKDFKEPEYHHKIQYIDGGKSEVENIAVLCDNCHAIRHRMDKNTISK